MEAVCGEMLAALRQQRQQQQHGVPSFMADPSALSSCATWLERSKDKWAQQAQLGADPADAMRHLFDWMDAVVNLTFARLHTARNNVGASVVGTRAVVLAVVQLFEEDTALSAVVSLVNHALASFAPPLPEAALSDSAVRMAMPSGSWSSMWSTLPSLTQRVLCVCCTQALLATICAAPAEWTAHAPQVLRVVVSYRGARDPALASALGRLVTLAQDAEDALAIVRQLLSYGMHALVLLGLQRTYTHDPQQAARFLTRVLADVPSPAAGLVLSDGKWNSAAGSPCDWALLLQLVLHNPASSTSQKAPAAVCSVVRAALDALTDTLLASRLDNVLLRRGEDEMDASAADAIRDAQRPCGALSSTWQWYRILLQQWLVSETPSLLAQCQLGVAPPASTAAAPSSSAPSAPSSSNDPPLTNLLVALCCSCEASDLGGFTAEVSNRVAELNARAPGQVKVLVWLLARVFQRCPMTGSKLAIDVLDTLLHSDIGLPAALAWSSELWNMSSFFSGGPSAVSAAGRSHPRVALTRMARCSVSSLRRQETATMPQENGNSDQQQQRQHHRHHQQHHQPGAVLAMGQAMLWAMDVERGDVSRPWVPQIPAPVLQLLEECLLSHQSTLTLEELSSARSIFVMCLKRHSAAAASSLARIIRTCCAHQPLRPGSRSAPDSQPQDQDVNLFQAIANPKSGRVFKHKKHHQLHTGSQRTEGQGIVVKRWEGWASSIACSLADSHARILLIKALEASMSVPAPWQMPAIPFNCTTLPSLPSFDRELDQLVDRCPIVLDVLSECIKTSEEFEAASPVLSSVLRLQHSKLIRLQKASKPCPPAVHRVLTAITNILRDSGKLDEEFARISLLWHRIRPSHLTNVIALLYSRLFTSTTSKAEQAATVLLKPFISDLDHLGAFLPDILHLS